MLLTGCTSIPQLAESPPAAPREFRGVWVATVNNIDWPSQPGLSAAQQRTEALAILDRAHALNLNTIILQVRPAADALYPSKLEPWTEYLAGQQGVDPGYDPLAFWVDEAHRRGLQLHAWFNPYRARHNLAKSDFAPNHIARTHPAAVKHYGDYYWMDPGDAFASQHTLEVVADVVKRYAVDGVHIDDYFYPYPIPAPLPPGAKLKPDQPNPEVDFPDEPSWKLYRAGGGKLERADWRRQNVDQLVKQLYRTTHDLKPQVLFGVSPFGLGRPDRRPAGIKGFSQYDKLYANVELWLERGWVDYLVPQIYWPESRKELPFAPLLDYWLAQNTAGRHVWSGLFTSAISDEKVWTPADITRQIALTRARPAASGHVHFSMVALMDDRRGIDELVTPLYATPALTPATPWLGAVRSEAPGVKPQKGGSVLIKLAPGATAANFAIWKRHGAAWSFSVQPGNMPLVDVTGADAVVVSTVDRAGNESPRVALTLARAKKP